LQGHPTRTQNVRSPVNTWILWQVEQCGELLGLVVDREGEGANVEEEMAVVALLLGLVKLFSGTALFQCPSAPALLESTPRLTGV
jgi:hypothetical protein